MNPYMKFLYTITTYNTNMKHFLPLLLAAATPLSLWADSWGHMHPVTMSEATTKFATPPSDFANHVIWGWEGAMDLTTIQHDLDSIKQKGFKSVIFEAGYGLPYEYLSDAWFEAIKTGVTEAKKRGLKVWIIDEGKYPSGFAGGKFTRERPDLRMKAIVAIDTIRAERGTRLKGLKTKAISAVAVSRESLPNRTVEVKNGKITFDAGDHDWDIILAGSDFRTCQTRAVNNPTRGKDTSNSLCDYLDPAAVRQFIDWTHEQYKKTIGDEFGKTVLGFRGDEPDFAYTPWTPAITSEFISRKGYDPTPYYASLVLRTPTTEEENRFRADYWDVWSDLFARHFFKQQADWCDANELAHITHLNNDHNMPVCVRAEGSLFRTLSKVQIPGIDAIWNQIWPKTINNYPKYASSVAHVYGKPRAFSESFAAYRTPPTLPTAKYAIDYQLTRGINFFEFMFWPSGSTEPNWMTDPGMKNLNDYSNRACYLFTQGVPGARIAVFYPTSTLWLKDNSIDPDLNTIAQQLLHHQRDFDWVDEDAFSEALTIGNGYMENRSGQRYYTLIIPSCDVIPEAMWRQVEAFANHGGKVLFWGKHPTMTVSRSYMRPDSITQLQHNALYEPKCQWSNIVEQALPKPEISIGQPSDSLPVTYAHRVLNDAHLYMLFNEGEEALTFDVEFDQAGTMDEWNAYTGKTTPVGSAATSTGGTRRRFTLAPWESRIVSITPQTSTYNAKDLGVSGDGSIETRALQAAIDFIAQRGGGTLKLTAGQYMSGALFFPRGVNLHLDNGATLLASANPEDYTTVDTRFEGTERKWCCALLNFWHSEGVQVSGEGTIDGNGIAWKQHPFYPYGRPRLMAITSCDGGSVKGIKLQNQASWGLHVLYTQGFTIDGVSISVPDYVPSSDGIDIDSSSDVKVLNSHISVHDDCISIKSGKDEEGRNISRPSENITIENCHFAYGHGAVAIGSEISGSVRHVKVNRCTVDGGNWSCFRFKSQPSRGGIIDDIRFEEVTCNDVRNIFDINLDWRAGSQRDSVFVYANPTTLLSGISFVRCSGTASSLGSVKGYAQAPIHRDTFSFKDCNFTTETGLRLQFADFPSSGIKTIVKNGKKRLISQ